MHDIHENNIEILKELGGTGAIKERVMRFNTQGRAVFGWVCTYVPEEIIYAAGLLPIRITGDGSAGKNATAYLYVNTCPFALGCLEQGIGGKYDFLEGFVAANSCDPIRRLFDVWQIYLTTPFNYIIGVPRKLSANAYDFFRKEVVKFKDRLADFLGASISEDSLRGAIHIYNKSRALLRNLYQMRRVKQPLISASETLQIIRASMVMPRDHFNYFLEKVLAEISQRPALSEARARLLLCGSLVDNPLFLEMIEDLGGLIVADELCTGSRYFWDLVAEDSNPLISLADRYLSHSPCARMRPLNHRFDHISNLVQEYKIEGAISQSLKFCDIYGHSKPRLEEKLAELGIPVLDLDLEYDLSGIGQLRTRVQSFLEMIEGRRK